MSTHQHFSQGMVLFTFYSKFCANSSPLYPVICAHVSCNARTCRVTVERRWWGRWLDVGPSPCRASPGTNPVRRRPSSPPAVFRLDHAHRAVDRHVTDASSAVSAAQQLSQTGFFQLPAYGLELSPGCHPGPGNQYTLFETCS